IFASRNRQNQGRRPEISGGDFGDRESGSLARYGLPIERPILPHPDFRGAEFQMRYSHIAAIGSAIFGSCFLYTSSGVPCRFSKSSDVILTYPVTHGASSVANAVCTLLRGCHPSLSIENCRSGILKEPGINYQLGLPSGTYAPFGAILAAESSSSIFAS